MKNVYKFTKPLLFISTLLAFVFSFSACKKIENKINSIIIHKKYKYVYVLSTINGDKTYTFIGTEHSKLYFENGCIKHTNSTQFSEDIMCNLISCQLISVTELK